MTRLRLLLVIVCCCGMGAAAIGDDAKASGVEIRSTDGKVFIAANEIVSYEWTTHTMTMKEGLRKELLERFKQIAPKHGLNAGIPFEVCVDGKKIYAGTWKTSLSSIGNASVVIVWNSLHMYKELGEDQLRIDPCYPNQPGFKGADPRGDERVKAALQAAKKLK